MKKRKPKPDVEFTYRVLASLQSDLEELCEATRRVGVQINALAKEYDLKRAA